MDGMIISGGLVVGVIIVVLVLIILASCINIVPQANAYIIERLGAYIGTWSVGIHFKVPFLDRVVRRVNLKEQVMDFPPQPVITKDNVSIRINAVLYYSIFDAAKVIISVENYKFAVGQLAQTTMRNAVGAVTLDELLAQRDRISEEICKIIDEATDPWGIKVENVELKDISLPEEMKRVLAIAAEAEREKAAVITKAEGEAMAAENLAKAAETMTSTPGALHLRTLSTLSDISADKSNTIVVALPIEVLEAIKGKDKDKK